MCVKKTPSEFTEDENIPDDTRPFSGGTLRSGNYDGAIRDISILPRRSKKRANR